MIIKIITIILYIGIMTQTFAIDENLIETLKVGAPLLFFIGAPFIIAAIIVIAIKILIHGGKLIFDLFKTEEY